MIGYKSNQNGCRNLRRLIDYNGDCIRCYFSQTRDGVWMGSRKCYESECLVLDPKNTSPAYLTEKEKEEAYA